MLSMSLVIFTIFFIRDQKLITVKNNAYGEQPDDRLNESHMLVPGLLYRLVIFSKRHISRCDLLREAKIQDLRFKKEFSDWLLR